jgi:hypothetical protein
MVKALVLFAVLGSACASTPTVSPGYYAQVREQRRAAQDAWEVREIELAKLHPNAKPRLRTSCPEKAPAGARLGYCPF